MGLTVDENVILDKSSVWKNHVESEILSQIISTKCGGTATARHEADKAVIGSGIDIIVPISSTAKDGTGQVLGKNSSDH